MLLVRRAPELSGAERYRIAIRALTRVGHPYSIWAIPRLAIGALIGFFSPAKGVRVAQTPACSTLYADSYLEVTETLLVKTATRDVWPGHISATNRLVDVNVPWVKVEE